MELGVKHDHVLLHDLYRSRNSEFLHFVVRIFPWMDVYTSCARENLKMVNIVRIESMLMFQVCLFIKDF